MTQAQAKVFSDTPAGRRGIFYLKTDIPVDDAVLKGLKQANLKEAKTRCAALAEAIRHACGEKVRDVTPGPAQGTFHLIHHVTLQSGSRRVARSAVPGIFERDEGMALEPYAQDKCRELGLPHLQTYVLDINGRYAPFGFLLTDMAPGRSLAAFDDKEIDEPARLRALGAAMRRWHAIEASGAGLIDFASLQSGSGPRGVHESWHTYLTFNLERHVATCLSLNLVDKATAADIQQWFAKAPASHPVCLLHGDPGNHNLFMDGMKLSAVVDWEDALAGDPLYDVAFWATFHPQRRWKAFLEGYGIADTKDRGFAVPFALYFLRVVLAKLVHRHRFGYKDVPGRPTAKERLAQAVQQVRETV